MALFLGCNVLFVVVLEWGVAGVLYGQLASTAAWAFLALTLIWSDFGLTPEPAIAIELLRFGLPFLPVLLVTWVIDFSDRYLLDLYVSTSEVGLYSLGYRLGQVMTLVVTAFTLGWAPIRYKILRQPEPQLVYARIATLYLAGAGAIWLGLTLFAQQAVALLSPPEFQAASVFVGPVAFGYLLYGLFVLAVTGMGVMKRTSSMPWLGLAAAVSNVGLNLLLIPRYGALAAAYTTVLAYAMLTFGSLAVSQRLYRIPYQYGRWALLWGGMLGLAGAASLLPPMPAVSDLAVRIGLLALYVFFVLASETLRPNELAQLSAWGLAILPSWHASA